MDVCDEIEGGCHAVRGHVEVPQDLQSPLRQHDQGRRSGRCVGSHSATLGRLHGTRRIAQTQGQRGHDLPDRGGHGRRRHLDVHHAEDRAGVREDVRRNSSLKLPAATQLLIAMSEYIVDLLVPDPGHPGRHLAVHQAGPQVPARPHGLGHVHAQGAHLWPAGRKEHHGPHDADARHAGGQRCADSGRLEHHARDGRQRVVRTTVRQGDRRDSRRRNDRQADEG